MKFSVTGSTERGSLVLFWPALLPADFEQRWAEEPAELGDELQTTGKVIWFSCDANGESSLGLFVDEPVPEGLQTFCTLSEKVEALQAAGEGWFCGAEAVFRDDRSYLDQHPRKGSAVQVPAGKYLAEVFTTEIPDSVYEDWIKTEAGSRAQQLWWIQTWFASTGIVAAMICVGCLFVGTQEMTRCVRGLRNPAVHWLAPFSHARLSARATSATGVRSSVSKFCSAVANSPPVA